MSDEERHAITLEIAAAAANLQAASQHITTLQAMLADLQARDE